MNQNENPLFELMLKDLLIEGDKYNLLNKLRLLIDEYNYSVYGLGMLSLSVHVINNNNNNWIKLTLSDLESGMNLECLGDSSGFRELIYYVEYKSNLVTG